LLIDGVVIQQESNEMNKMKRLLLLLFSPNVADDGML